MPQEQVRRLPGVRHLIASGAYATTRLNQELLPEIEFSVVTLSTSVPGLLLIGVVVSNAILLVNFIQDRTPATGTRRSTKRSWKRAGRASGLSL